jgi:hypothetical protein
MTRCSYRYITGPCCAYLAPEASHQRLLQPLHLFVDHSLDGHHGYVVAVNLHTQSTGLSVTYNAWQAVHRYAQVVNLRRSAQEKHGPSIVHNALDGSMGQIVTHLMHTLLTTAYLDFVGQPLCISCSTFEDFEVELPIGYLQGKMASPISRIGQNHTFTVCIRQFWQRNHKMYSHIRCKFRVMANPTHFIEASYQSVKLEWQS